MTTTIEQQIGKAVRENRKAFTVTGSEGDIFPYNLQRGRKVIQRTKTTIGADGTVTAWYTVRRGLGHAKRKTSAG